jgi:hypothetical protein
LQLEQVALEPEPDLKFEQVQVRLVYFVQPVPQVLQVVGVRHCVQPSRVQVKQVAVRPEPDLT